MRIVLYFLFVILLAKGLDAVSKCQTCVLMYTHSINRDDGDVDCKNNPKMTKFSKACGTAAEGDAWQCGIANVQADTGSYLWSRGCVKTSDCKGGKMTHTLDSKKVEAEWKCCNKMDVCNLGNGVHASFTMVFVGAVSAVLWLVRG